MCAYDSSVGGYHSRFTISKPSGAAVERESFGESVDEQHECKLVEFENNEENKSEYRSFSVKRANDVRAKSGFSKGGDKSIDIETG